MFNLLAITKTIIPYVTHLRKLPLVNNTSTAVLMQQLDYWFTKIGDGFYKFTAPCSNPDYRDGDSWCEELAFSKDEFRSAFNSIGVKHLSKSAYKKAADPFTEVLSDGTQVEKYYCSYTDKVKGLTYYFRNHTFADKVLKVLFQEPSFVNKKCQSTGDRECQSTDNGKLAMPIYVNRECQSTEVGNANLHSYTENTQKITSETTLPSLSPQLAKQEERENQFGFQIPKNESKKLESPIDSSVLLTKAEATLEIESQSVETVSPVAKNENNSQTHNVPQKYDPYFGRSRMKPNETQWDWLPLGAWMVEETRKLDENFIMAIASRWATEYGGKAADKRPNVIKHFRNNPTNLPIEWEWYQEKYLHKAANVQVRKINGLDTAEDEAEIMKHQRALVPLDATHCVTEIRTPVEIVQQSAPYALGSIQINRTSMLSGITEGHEAYTQTANPEDSSFWAKLAGRKIPSGRLREKYQNCKPSQNASEDVVNASEGLSKCKSIIDALRLNRESSKKTPAIQMDSTPIDHDQILEDMRKRLKSGVESLRKEAIAWVKNIDNGCELVLTNGVVTDIKEIDF